MAHDNPESAVNEVLTGSDTARVDTDFWRGVRLGLPYALVGWVAMIVIGAVIWHLLAT